MCVLSPLCSSSGPFLSSIVTYTQGFSSLFAVDNSSMYPQFPGSCKNISNSTCSTLNLRSTHIQTFKTGFPQVPISLNGTTKTEILLSVSPVCPTPSFKPSLVLTILPPDLLSNFYSSLCPCWHHCIPTDQLFLPGLLMSLLTEFPSTLAPVYPPQGRIWILSKYK